MRIISVTASTNISGPNYILSASGQLTLNLPQNSQVIPLTFTVGTGNLSGGIGQISLRVAGAGLTLTNVILSNHGLSASNASIQLPAFLGGATGVISQVNVTRSGLDFGAANIAQPIPDFGFAPYITLTQNLVTLGISNTGASKQFRLTGSSVLSITLPDFNQTKPVSFTLDPGTLFSRSVGLSAMASPTPTDYILLLKVRSNLQSTVEIH
jgi:hypothetical protein